MRGGNGWWAARAMMGGGDGDRRVRRKKMNSEDVGGDGRVCARKVSGARAEKETRVKGPDVLLDDRRKYNSSALIALFCRTNSY